METPDTLNYLTAGYAVIFGGLLLYILSIAFRTRRLRRDLEDLEDHNDLK